MQLSCNTHALAYSCFQSSRVLLPDDMKTPLIKCPEHRQESNHAEQLEPDGLVIRRKNRKIQRSTDLVPHSVVITCDHVEVIIAGRQARVLYSAVVDHFSPSWILSVKFVAKMHLLRRGQT